jgi:SOS-response transcriptional repressor LexA
MNAGRREPAALFWIGLTDDAMAPHARCGASVCIDTTLTPRAGDGVLVADPMGRTFVRILQPGVSPANWSAVPSSPGYPTMNSQRDRLRLVGVVVSVRQRWSEQGSSAPAAAVQEASA